MVTDEIIGFLYTPLDNFILLAAKILKSLFALM